MKFGVGSIVKILRKGERIWVKVTGRADEYVINGIIDSHPQDESIGVYGSPIQFLLPEIMDVYKDEPK